MSLKSTIEDRNIRSQRARVALRIFLQRCAVRMGAESLVLADSRGRSVVCTDETLDASAAARNAALLYLEGVPVPDDADREQQVWPLALGNEDGYLLALGEFAVSKEEITETFEGITRILDNHE